MDKIIFRIVKPTLEIIIFILLIASLISVCFVLYEAFQMKFCISNICLINLIKLFSKYSGLYSSAFIVSASYYAIYQLIEVKASNNNLTNQIRISSEDISNRNKRESINKTVEECKFFYDEIQPSIKKLYHDLNAIKFPFWHIQWEIGDFTEENIFEQDRNWHKEFDGLMPDHENTYADIILTINKIEAFAISFIDGIADKDCGKKAVGHAYKRQIENIYPFLAIWRSRVRKYDENFYNKTIELYQEWKDQD